MDHNVNAAIRRARPRICLPRQEELSLWRKMRSGDIEARNRLVESQLPWLLRLAGKFVSPRHPIDDLFQTAAEELLHSLERYDARITRLSTYCVRAVHWRLIELVQKDREALVRPAACRSKHADKWHAAGAEAIHITRDFNKGVDDPVFDDQRERDKLRAAIEQLPERMRIIMQGRLAGETLRQLGDRLGLSKERIRQIETKAYGFLRNSLIGSGS